ncbi:MAG: hypothetical protein HY321_12250 [Armatimonadetes bacterium]|nr:hypothetical protein [Armatimonadota bacterium]
MKRDCLEGRHAGGFHMVYADGHVKWTTANDPANEAAKLAAVTGDPANGGKWHPSNP